MFACCGANPKKSKVPIQQQLQYTNQISLNLSQLIIASYDQKAKKWTSRTPLFNALPSAPVPVPPPPQLPIHSQPSNIETSEQRELRIQQSKLQKLKSELAELQYRATATKKRRDDFERKKLKEQITLKLVEKMILDEKIQFDREVNRLKEVEDQ